jgi:hypothetical protein
MRPSGSLTGKRLKQRSGCSGPLSQLLPGQNARLNDELRKARFIIHVPKKVAALLGHQLADEDPESISSWISS